MTEAVNFVAETDCYTIEGLTVNCFFLPDFNSPAFTDPADIY